ncbi:hypothetical protein NQ318_020239 [Aromia moschata]|uniref:Uncharacterized protein n=1 Tax=Aromia moschata TaxID=1265417 RepID=A0AAV8ZC61_9CUCU|nr:hypothetical protein NQ318_020239 [Aromia moschata]
MLSVQMEQLVNLKFKEGRETTEDDPRPGRPSTSKTDENIEKMDGYQPSAANVKHTEASRCLAFGRNYYEIPRVDGGKTSGFPTRNRKRYTCEASAITASQTTRVLSVIADIPYYKIKTYL